MRLFCAYTGMLIALFVFLLSCKSGEKGKKEFTDYKIENIEDFNKYKKDFDISGLRKFDLRQACLLDYYKGPCGLKYDDDSILNVKNYNIAFTDSSNTAIDIVSFKSEHYAMMIAKELEPFVKAVRRFDGKEIKNNLCLTDYLDRVYNFTRKKNNLYLFGYDGYNVSLGTITIDKLKHLDMVCDAIK